MWDGNVPFKWDEKRHYSEAFTVYFDAYELKSTAVQPGKG